MKNKLNFKTLVIEVVSIVAGVLIALGVNEWNQNRSHHNDAIAALEKITSEIKKNIELLENVHKNNALLVEKMVQSDASSTAKDEEEEEGMFRPGLQMQDTAWQTTISSGVSQYIQYDDLFAISEVYSMQEIYKKFTYQLVQAMLNQRAMAVITDVDKKENASRAFDEYITLVVSIEKSLLDAYQQLDEKLVKKGYAIIEQKPD